MNQNTLLTGIVLALSFVAVWLFVNYSFAATSGWHLLAKRYRTTTSPHGPILEWQVYRMGSLQETGITILTTSPLGLHLSRVDLFRPFHPPLLIPWHTITKVTEGRTWWGRQWVQLDLDGITGLRVGIRALRAMAPYLPPVANAAA